MALGLIALSHAPLMGSHDPDEQTLREVENAFKGARGYVRDFDPELVVLFAPDHYNGVFYELMPQFCVAMAATSVGDWRSTPGRVRVDRETSLAVARAALAADFDIAVSERLEVDHGFAQPLDVLFGGIDSVPVVPVFINCVGEPLGPVRRARLLGEAVGRAAAELGRRVLLIASGGLSHDPPVPRLDGASPEVAERLIAGRHPSPEARQQRETMVTRVGAEFTRGTAAIMPLNPEWDLAFLDLLAGGRLAEVDAWTGDWMVTTAGHAAHEVRTWIAAYSALASQGSYRMTSCFYRPIPEWIAGFSVTTAELD
jgi:2,3-dihydroxyphenylpropionate 1,2-dioxygenase